MRCRCAGAGRRWACLVVALRAFGIAAGWSASSGCWAPDGILPTVARRPAGPVGRHSWRAGRILSSLRLRLGNIDHRGSVLAPSVPRLATILQLEDPLLSFGSAYTWSEDLHLASGMSCPAHTAALPAGTLQSEAAQCFPSVCMHSLGLHIIGNINEMACDLSRNPACGHYY